MFEVGEGDKSLQLQRFLQFIPVTGSRELERRRPNEVLALGMISELHLLERVLLVGVVIVTSEIYLLERVLRVGVVIVTSEIYLLERVLRVGVVIVTSEIYLLERVLRVGVVIVTSELR